MKTKHKRPAFERLPVTAPNTVELVPNYNRKPGQPTHVFVARTR